MSTSTAKIAAATVPAGNRRAALVTLWRLSALATSGAALSGLAGCGGGGDAPAPAPPSPAPAPAAQPAPPPKTTTLSASLLNPWGLAFLPDGRMLVTQKAGAMVMLNAAGTSEVAQIAGVPAVANFGQGGLLDIALDPDFDLATRPWVYWSCSEAAGSVSGTAVARGRLVGSGSNWMLQDVAVIFRQQPKVSGGNHFGSRLAFRGDKTLFVTLGERQLGSPAQDLGSHLGKVVRIERDGSVPSDNPVSLKSGGLTELWSYGHRNPQGAAIHPDTGELWLTEHGPQGGDELNVVRAGNNYGWPLKSYGCDYGVTTPNCQIGGGIHAPAYAEPVSYWPGADTPAPAPSIAPSGLLFYTGAGFPEWHGNAFLGALAGAALWRVTLNGTTEVAREKLFADLAERVRCVRQGPDGWLYLLTDSGKLIRIDR